MQLKDKVAIVTGSGRGIGAGIADALAKEGAILSSWTGIWRMPKSEAEKIESAGGRAMAVEGDVTKKATLDAMVAAVLQNPEGSTSSSTTPASSRCRCCSRTSPTRNGTGP